MRLWMAYFLMLGLFFTCGCEDIFDVDTGSTAGDEAAVADAVPDGGTSDTTEDGETATAGDVSTATSVSATSAGVVWLHTDVSGWSQTATLSSVSINGDLIALNYDKTRVWPSAIPLSGTPLNANAWIFVRRDGVWYAATWEWMKPGQTSKAVSAVNGGHIGQAPLHDFSPKSGEVYGFMVSGLARNSTRNVYERSNVVMFRWP